MPNERKPIQPAPPPAEIDLFGDQLPDRVKPEPVPEVWRKASPKARKLAEAGAQNQDGVLAMSAEEWIEMDEASDAYTAHVLAEKAAAEKAAAENDE